jgi:hypothetical protein
MPKVGSKKFSYSPKGQKAARAYARKLGKSVKTSKGKAGTRRTSGKSY